MPIKKIELLKALDTIIQDYLKDAIKALLAFLAKVFLNIYGASVLLLLSTLLLGLINWLKIPITIPAYVVGVMFVSIVCGVLIIQRLHKKLEFKQCEIEYDGLLWKVDENNSVFGPLCPKCKKEMTITDRQFDNAADVIFGSTPEYIFTCCCGHKVNGSVPPSEMARMAQNKVLNQTKSG